MPYKARLFSIFSVFIVVLSSLALPTSAAALAITGVNPTIVVNSVSNDVTITGTDFAADVVVTLDPGVIPLTIKSWSTTSLVVTVPVGTAPYVYSIVVTNPSDPAPNSQAFYSFTVTAAPPPPTATNTPAPTNTPGPFGRPQVVIKSYRTNVGQISYGKDFNLVVRLENAGQFTAYNAQATFTSSDLTPLKTGGVDVIGNIDANTSVDAGQQMTASAQLYGKTSVTVDMTVSYYDDKGTAYSEKFTLNIPVTAGNYVYASATPTNMKRSQLVITGYKTDTEPLQPGIQFSLELTVQNVGNSLAKGVTMIVGGGSASSGGGSTPQPGGVSGGSGEFTNFAPVGTSNVQSLGDFAPGSTLTASQKLIVNVSTNPGAYPVKITFAYTDEKGVSVNDEQVITMLIYSLPNVDVSFYQPVNSLMIGQPNPLPLQVVNLGKRNSVLGNIKLSTENGRIENGMGLVGSLDPGGYYTLDAMIYPEAPGQLTLTVLIEYTDDFNQARSITKTIDLEVLDMPVEPTFDPNMPPSEGGGGGEGGMPVMPGEETFLQKAWRFVLGLLGLDSSVQQERPIEPPMEEMTPMPVPAGKGGKG